MAGPTRRLAKKATSTVVPVIDGVPTIPGPVVDIDAQPLIINGTEPDESTEDTEEVPSGEPAKPAMIHDLYTRVEDLAVSANPELAHAQWAAQVTVTLDRIVEVLSVVAQQQQWTVNNVTEMFGQFQGIMSSGNPLGLFKAILGGGRKGRQEEVSTDGG